MLVPLIVLNVAPIGLVRPMSTVDRMSRPGAATCTPVPRLLKSVSIVPDGSTAATAITPGQFAGKVPDTSAPPPFPAAATTVTPRPSAYATASAIAAGQAARPPMLRLIT